MKYSVGDTVIIRSDLDVHTSYDMCNFVYDMEPYRGMMAKIIKARRTARGDRYRIDIDGQEWSWSNSMFMDIPDEEMDTSDFDLMELLRGGACVS